MHELKPFFDGYSTKADVYALVGTLRKCKAIQKEQARLLWDVNDWRNEAVHGAGWTEWELVKKAQPRFPGHRQPKVPLWGYEDEADPAVIFDLPITERYHAALKLLGIDPWKLSREGGRSGQADHARDGRGPGRAEPARRPARRCSASINTAN